MKIPFHFRLAVELLGWEDCFFFFNVYNHVLCVLLYSRFCCRLSTYWAFNSLLVATPARDGRRNRRRHIGILKELNLGLSHLPCEWFLSSHLSFLLKAHEKDRQRNTQRHAEARHVTPTVAVIKKFKNDFQQQFSLPTVAPPGWILFLIVPDRPICFPRILPAWTPSCCVYVHLLQCKCAFFPCARLVLAAPRCKVMLCHIHCV